MNAIIKKKGFSLIEVLIALGLFAVSLTVLAFAVNSAYIGLMGFESEVAREEDLRFLRHVLPYELSKEMLLRGGKITVPHGETVEWKVQLEPFDRLVDFWTLTIEYHFETSPRRVTEVYQRFVKGWMDEVERSTRLQAKRDQFATDNRYQE